MNSALSLNTTWTAANFINYIERSFSDTVPDWYDSLSEDAKITSKSNGKTSCHVQKFVQRN